MHLLHFLVVLSIAVFAQCLYQDTSHVWERGPLAVDSHVFTRNDTDITMQTQVFFPTEIDDDDFAVWYYVGGFDGILPPEMYTNLLDNVASHGYIVAGTFPVLGADGFNLSYTAHLANLQWLKENMADAISAVPSWDHLSYGCHSAGCGSTYQMTDFDPEQVMSNIFLEPVSPAIHRGEKYVKPAIMLGAALATWDCSVPGVDHVTYFNYWECPRILMEAQDFGHCDFMDYGVWAVCNTTNYCETAPFDVLQQYRDFVQGISAAYMNAYVQGQMHYLDYLLAEEDIPLNLSMYETDTECMGQRTADLPQLDNY